MTLAVGFPGPVEQCLAGLVAWIVVLDLVSSELEYVGTVFEAWNVKHGKDHTFEKIHHGAMTSFLQSSLTSAAWSLSRPPTTLLYLSALGSGLCVTVFHSMC